MSHYLAYLRLLELKPFLELLADDERLYLSGTTEAHAKAREMVRMIREDALFWHHLVRYVPYSFIQLLLHRF